MRKGSALLACGAILALTAGAQAESGHLGSAEATPPGLSNPPGVSNPTGSDAGQSHASPVAGHGGSHWGYEDKDGPDHWGELSPDYHLCKAGTTQSPIDLSGFVGATIVPMDFDYQTAPLKILHNGHTVQVNYAPGSSITVGGKRYELLQFHFHGPSEHSLHGLHAAMEVHFVHKSTDGELAVVGVMMESGKDNLPLRAIWEKMPVKAGSERVHERVLINARDLLPDDKRYYRYMGSLTTPPCSEDVSWFVLAAPIQVGVNQVKQFFDAVGANSRPVQPEYRRFVLAPPDEK